MLVEKYNPMLTLTPAQKLIKAEWGKLPEQDRSYYNYSFAQFLKSKEMK